MGEDVIAPLLKNRTDLLITFIPSFLLNLIRKAKASKSTATVKELIELNKWTSSSKAFDVLKDGVFRIDRFGQEKDEKEFLDSLETVLLNGKFETVSDVKPLMGDAESFITFCNEARLQQTELLDLCKWLSITIEDQLDGQILVVEGTTKAEIGLVKERYNEGASRGVLAHAGIDWRQSDILIVLGPSGSGKSFLRSRKRPNQLSVCRQARNS